MNLYDLIEARQALHAELGTFLDDVEARGTANAPASKAKYTRMRTDLDELDARIGEATALAKRNDAANATVARLGLGSMRPSDGLSADVRSFLVGDGRRSLEITAPAGASVRDLSKGSAGAGAATVPTSFYGQLQQHMINTAAVIGIAKVLNTRSGEALQIPKTTAHSTAALVAEGASISESDPTFAQVTLDAYKYAVAIQVTRELVEDTGVDLLGYLAEECGRALGNACGTHFVTGDGTAKPLGALTASTLGVTGGAGVAGAFTADNLIDLHHSVIPSYRANASWLMNDATWAKVRKLKDSDNNYLIGSLAGGESLTLLGKPVVIDPNMPDVALGAKSVLFGAFDRYFIRQVNGVKFERSDDYAFLNDLVTFKATLRIDGDLVDTTGCLRHFIGNAA